MLEEKIGTPYFMSPEVITKWYSGKCDVWALGIICYFMLSGTLPFVDKDRELLFHKILHQKLVIMNLNWPGVSDDAKDFVSQSLIR